MAIAPIRASDRRRLASVSALAPARPSDRRRPQVFTSLAPGLGPPRARIRGLRRERGGRAYTVTLTAIDAAGSTASSRQRMNVR